MKKLIFSFLLSVLFLLPSITAPRDLSAESKRDKESLTCPVVGVKVMNSFFVESERTCFPNWKKAAKAGFLPLRVRKKDRVKSKRKVNLCKVVGLIPTGQYVESDYRECFVDEEAAIEHGYKHFSDGRTPTARPTNTRTPGTATAVPSKTPTIRVTSASTPDATQTSIPSRTSTPSRTPTFTPTNTRTSTPTRTATFTPTFTSSPTMTATPTATSTSGNPPTSFSFDLGPSHDHTEYSGHCNGTMNGERTNFSFSCSHNVTTATWSHLHLLDNTEICTLMSPPLNFSLSCAITPLEADAISSGKALVDIHTGPGEGSDQVLAGLTVPVP
jgi:hypothetical protein